MGAIPIGTPESSEQGNSTAIPIPDSLPTNPIVLTESNVNTDGNPVTIPDSVPTNPTVLTEPAGESGGSPITIPDSLPANPTVLTEPANESGGSPITVPDELPSNPVVLTDATIVEEGSPITIPTQLPVDPTVLIDGLEIPTKTEGFTLGPAHRIPFMNGNRDDFSYDVGFEYNMDTNTMTVENITLAGLADLNSMSMGGITVDTIETTLTDDDSHIPTSGAVFDAIAAVAFGNLTGEVTSVGLTTSLHISSITAQPDLPVGLLSTDELLVNNGGVLNRMDISVLQSYMQSNLTLTTYTHPNHTGQVLSTGDGATTLDDSAITAQTLLATALLGSDEMLMSDAGSIRRMSITTLEAYMQANLSFGAGVSDHGALNGLGDDDHAIYYNASRLTTWGNAYTGSATIVTLGTIATGVWQGSVIGQAYTLPAQATHAGEFLTTDGATATWATFTGVTSVTGGYGITSTGGATPDIAFDGTELDIDDGTAFGTFPGNQASTWILFVSGAVSERILASITPLSSFDNDLGWTTNVGTVTNVSASSPLASSGGATPNISFDATSIPIMGGALLAEDYILVTETSDSGLMKQKLISSVPLSEFNNNEGWDTGTVESVLGGYGIVSDADPVNPSLSFDASELDIDDGTAFAGTSYFVFRAGAVSELRRTTSVDISTFVNDTGFTTNTGTVTNVTATTPLASSGGTTPNITFDASSIATKGGAVLEDDFMVTIDGVSGAMEKKALEFIPLSAFNDDISVFGTSSQIPYTNATNNGFLYSGLFTYDDDAFKHGGTTNLGSTATNVLLFYQGGVETNNTMYHRVWAIRNATGSDWLTASLHDAISVDSSFATPGTDTKCWWERDPQIGEHTWGDSATEFFKVNSEGIHFDQYTLSNSTDRSGLLEIKGDGTGYAGIQIHADDVASSPGTFWSVMGQLGNFGLYDDTNGDWILNHTLNGKTSLYYAGSEKIQTTSTGISITGRIDATDRISISESVNGQNNLVSLTNSNTGTAAGTGILLAANGNNVALVSYGDTHATWGANHSRLQSTAGGCNIGIGSTAETGFLWTLDGDVKLYYNNSEKFATTTTGIDVTGAIVASGEITAFG